jgi:hypothetical protein
MTNEHYPNRGFRDDGPLEDRDADLLGETMEIDYRKWDGLVFINPPWEPEAIRTWITRTFLD